MTARLHRATRRYGPRGIRLYCGACDFMTTAGTGKAAQEEEFREHRRQVGEPVPQAKLPHWDRVKLVRQLHAPQHEVGSLVTCRECSSSPFVVEHPCLTIRILDGELRELPS